VHQAAKLQFERIVDEFVRWREVPDEARSPAPSWWWGPAFAVVGLRNPLPAASCTRLGLTEGATYADGARVILKFIAGQTSLPWPDHFPRRPKHSSPN
jgi:hypothetical protein